MCGWLLAETIYKPLRGCLAIVEKRERSIIRGYRRGPAIRSFGSINNPCNSYGIDRNAKAFISQPSRSSLISVLIKVNETTALEHPFSA